MVFVSGLMGWKTCGVPLTNLINIALLNAVNAVSLPTVEVAVTNCLPRIQEYILPITRESMVE